MTREEAINEIKSWDFLEGKEIEAIHTLIPELAEREDKRIREDIIGGLMWQRDNLKSEGPHDNNLILPGFCFTVGEHLAYLEKQKESLHIPETCTENADSFTEEDERIRKEIIEFIQWAEDRGMTRHDFHQAKRPSEWISWLEKQKKQKTIIQDVELNDAIYDYVRDHFIAGADFTPEYIKKLMENAFFAGVDYYLLKQESESCEPDTNVEKVIEDVIRVYGKTQGEWVGGYDVDTLIVNLRRAFNKKEHKDPHYTKRNALFDKCVENCDPDVMKKVSDEVDEMLQKEQKPVEPSYSNDNSEYDKGYMDGKAFQLKQTEQYSIGKTFMGLIPCWVNAPSTLQPAHKYHGRNAVIMHENNGGFRCCFIDDEKATTIHLPENTLFVEGWRKKPVEWSEEDEKRVKQLIYDTEHIRAEYEKRKKELGKSFNEELIKDCDEQIAWLKSLRP